MWKILLNYLILFICVVGFGGGAMLALVLPVLQVLLSWFHYHYSDKWQTVMMQEIHLLISTAAGLFLAGYLYLAYVSNDPESVLVFLEIWRGGVFVALSLGIITTALKYFSIKRRL